MGTETTPLRCRRYSFDLRIVKLNNLHKGSEQTNIFFKKQK